MARTSMAKGFTTLLYMRLFVLASLSLGLGEAQSQSSRTMTPQFEVSSIKQNISQSDASKISSSSPDRFVATNVPVRFLILYSFELLDHQLVGAPDWTFDKSFDVVGTYPGQQRPTDSEIHIMLQNLLADRFGLKLYREQRELPAYDLVVARKDRRMGPQFHKSDVDCATWNAEKRPKTDAGGPSPVSPSGKRPACTMIATRKYLTGGTRTIQELAAALQSMLGRPVVDKTGLTGTYDIDLQWAPTDLHADPVANTASSEGPSIFTAVQEQLGLKLVPQKEKFSVFVVSEIRPPNPN